MLSGEQLKFLRYTHNVTQQRMSEWCDTSKRYICMIEKNECTPSQEIYDAWINCCYGIGSPIKRESKKGKTREIGD